MVSFKRELEWHFIMLLVALLLAVVATAKALTCSAAGNMGPCIMGSCPPAPASTCLNQGAPDEMCCDNTQIINPTTLPPTIPPVTTLPPATVPTGTTGGIIIPTTTSTTTTCADLLNPSTGVSDCPSRAYLCNDATYYSLMTQQCPKTCGRCSGTSVTSSTSCVDKLNPSTGVSDCPSRAYLCNDATYYSVMTVQCPKTCSRCTATATTITSSSCVDKLNPSTGVSDCPSRASLCNDSTYYSLMTDQCPKTCGRCSSSTSVTSSTATCADQVNPSTGVSDCSKMSSYCNVASYYTLMTQQCPRTCGRCSG